MMHDLYVYGGNYRLTAHIKWDYYESKTASKLHLDFCSWGIGDPEDFVLAIVQGLANKFGASVKVNASWSVSGRLIGATIEAPVSRYRFRSYRDALLARLRELGEVKHFYIPHWARR